MPLSSLPPSRGWMWLLRQVVVGWIMLLLLPSTPTCQALSPIQNTGRPRATADESLEWQGDSCVQCSDTESYSTAALCVRKPDKVTQTATQGSASLSTATTRRNVLTKATLMVLATGTGAATAFTPRPVGALEVVQTRATCDATVSVWRLGHRLVYLLGTAHISEQSATLAAQLVRDTHPGAVFIELDLRRVAGGGAGMTVGPDGFVTTPVGGTLTLAPAGGGAPPSTSRVVVPQITPVSERPNAPDLRLLGSSGSGSSTTSSSMDGRNTGMADDTTSGATIVAPPAPPRKPNWLQSTLNDWGAAVIGRAIRGLYSNLGQAGFTPGEEFLVAVKEGQALGSDIVLGDQDVQVTLRRLSQALAVTDLNALTDPDSDLERSMAELFGGSTPGPSSEGKSAAEKKEELAAFIETMKSRDKVRQIMGELKKVAPALVQVMLTERDTYMATGLDSLQNYEVITAVMGLAHLDGVERNLQSFGWKRVKLNC